MRTRGRSCSHTHGRPLRLRRRQRWRRSARRLALLGRSASLRATANSTEGEGDLRRLWTPLTTWSLPRAPPPGPPRGAPRRSLRRSRPPSEPGARQTRCQRRLRRVRGVWMPSRRQQRREPGSGKRALARRSTVSPERRAAPRHESCVGQQTCVFGACGRLLKRKDHFLALQETQPCGARRCACMLTSGAVARVKKQVPGLVSCRQTCAEHRLDAGTEGSTGEAVGALARADGRVRARVERPACASRGALIKWSTQSRFFYVHAARCRTVMSMPTSARVRK